MLGFRVTWGPLQRSGSIFAVQFSKASWGGQDYESGSSREEYGSLDKSSVRLEEFTRPV
jgi:hypothetical protein